MPTPTASESTGASWLQEGAPSLRSVVTLLPTPTSMDSVGSGGSNPTRVTLVDAAIGRRGLVHGAAPSLAEGFGPYAAAISRWERVLGRPAPAPTVVGKRGAPRLSSAFVEWMQGLPEGHVVGRGMFRIQELRMLGNGVVPLQAAAAVDALLDRAVSQGIEVAA